MGTSVILLAHGSRDPRWKAPFEALLEEIRNVRKDVKLAYWELTEPSLESVVEACVQAGEQNLAVLPLFLAQGKHLREDLPAQIADLEARFPCTLRLLPPVGEHPEFAGFLATLVGKLIEKEGADS
ncbi:CbiX/SirB N-terminal domain-containing protein [Hahella sp. SMD15-11]|uniref:CbiX/SirB N-terminal domain-containing protein n=1 Tax=Thermohahella caldifontis TaxID=3142973 RepID=A0AB39UXE5_9GAMM